MKKIYLLIIVVICLSSCQIEGLTSGYSHLSKAGKERVVDYKGEISDISDYSNIYTVTVKQVKNYLSAHNDVVVYDYTPYCRTVHCISPDSLYTLCQEKEMDFLVISNVYDDVFGAINKRFPILMIKTEEYQTKWRAKYIDLFYQALIGVSSKEIDYALYHYFHNGTYVKSFKDANKIVAESTQK